MTPGLAVCRTALFVRRIAARGGVTRVIPKGAEVIDPSIR